MAFPTSLVYGRERIKGYLVHLDRFHNDLVDRVKIFATFFVVNITVRGSYGLVLGFVMIFIRLAWKS